MLKKLEVFANIMIVLAAVALIYFVARNQSYVGQPRRIAPQIGRKVSLPVEWGKNKNTLIVALQADCRYCTESAPSYRKLISEFSDNNDLAVIAAFSPTSAEDSHQAYLDKLGLQFKSVRTIPFASIEVTSTPSLVLVDEANTIVNFWNGKLSPAQERELFEVLSATK